jgi:hypothetical protein
MAMNNKCPVCGGKGTLPVPKRNAKELKATETKHAMAQTLIKAGYSYGEVADLLGYKSRSTVAFAVNKKK